MYENYCNHCGMNWKSDYPVHEETKCPDCISYDNQKFIEEINLKDWKDKVREERERVLDYFKSNKVFDFELYPYRLNHKKIEFKGKKLFVIKDKGRR